MTKKGGKSKGGAKARKQQPSRDVTERKCDERTQRNKIKKERRLKEFHSDYTDDDFVNFRRQLDYQGFKLREIQGDGNCLFRALADQLNGDDKLHLRHRREVVEFMKVHQKDFAPFLDETVTFEKYLKDLSSTGTYGGNDSIVAFARKNSVDVVIHQYNSPAFVVNGCADSSLVKLHLAYHTMEHYSSVRTKDDPGDGPAHLFHTSKLLQSKPGNKEKEEKSVNNKVKKTTEDGIKKDDIFLEEEKRRNIKEEKIEIIKNSSGFEEEEKIREYLEENDNDVDSTLSYILQLLALSSPRINNEDCEHSPPGVDQKDSSSKNVNSLLKEDENIAKPNDESGVTVAPNSNEEHVTGTPNSNDENVTGTPNSNEKHVTDTPNSNEEPVTDTPNSNEEPVTGTSNLNEIHVTDTLNLNEEHFRDTLNSNEERSVTDTLNSNKVRGVTYTPNSNEELEKKNIEDCSKTQTDENKSEKSELEVGPKKPNKPKGGTIPNKRKQVRHLSNRQRKDLAKQERKKRREENKRDPSLNKTYGEEVFGASASPVDIHVISI